MNTFRCQRQRSATLLYISAHQTSASPVYTLQFSSTSYDRISCKTWTTQQLPNGATPPFLTFLCRL